MTTRPRRLAREAALTVGAALGVLCVLTAVAMPLLGMKLLVFQSGSMGPDMDTGAIGITRTVDAADLAVGDVVSVTTSEGTRVTHRVTGIVPDGDQVLLELQGDANANPDREQYPVMQVDRVVAHVNKVGYIVDALASPYAVFLAGAAAAGLIVLTFRRKDGTTGPSEPTEPAEPTESTAPVESIGATGGSRHAVLAGAGVAVAVAGVAGVAAVGGGAWVPTLAAFSDTAQVQAATSSMTLPAPSGAVGCTNGGAFSGTVHVAWPAVANPPAGFRYRVDVYKTDPASPVATFTTTETRHDVRRADGLDSLSSYHVRVSGAIDGSTWASSGHIERTIGTGLMGYDINC